MFDYIFVYRKAELVCFVLTFVIKLTIFSQVHLTFDFVFQGGAQISHKSGHVQYRRIHEERGPCGLPYQDCQSGLQKIQFKLVCTAGDPFSQNRHRNQSSGEAPHQKVFLI
jgi:hypothetical protein